MSDLNQAKEFFSSIKRRKFLQVASLGGLAMAMRLPEMPAFFRKEKMGIVVHSYGYRWQSKTASEKYPGFLDAVDLIEHCHAIGAGGVQVGVGNWTQDFAKKVRDRREKSGLYLEGSIALPKKTGDVAAFDQEVKWAYEAGARVLRTVSLGPRRYEALHSYKEFLEFQDNALIALQLAEPVLNKYQVKLAVENHKDWRARELVAILKKVDSEWIGVTLDFGNSLALLEDPMETAETLAPYVFSTHVKDMGVGEYEKGFLLSEVPLGKGILDLPKIVSLCRQHNPKVTFNLEMITRNPLEIPCLTHGYWRTFEGQSGVELAPILKLVRERKSPLPKINQLNAEDLLAEEENNVVLSLDYSKNLLIL
jgi:sugar phosphate isomerase/epimerase